MRLAVLFSFPLYVVAFVVLQNILGIISDVKGRGAQLQRPNLLLPIFQMITMGLWLLGVVTMKHWKFHNLIDLRLVGFAVIVAGLYVSMWSQYALGSNWSGHIGIHKNHRLITTGPYKWVRNPMYSGMWLSGIGLCLVTINVFYGLAGFVWALAFSTRIPGEEDVLRKKFKRQYEEYYAHTGMLVPRLRRKC